MRLLLDTHCFIWFVIDSPRLRIAVKELIEDENNEKLLSIASVWKIAIKCSSGKLSFDRPFRGFIEQQLSLNSINLLNVTLAQLNVVSTLPFHHRDPFDRLLPNL